MSLLKLSGPLQLGRPNVFCKVPGRCQHRPRSCRVPQPAWSSKNMLQSTNMLKSIMMGDFCDSINVKKWLSFSIICWFHELSRCADTCTSSSARRDGCPAVKRLRMTHVRCVERQNLPWFHTKRFENGVRGRRMRWSAPFPMRGKRVSILIPFDFNCRISWTVFHCMMRLTTLRSGSSTTSCHCFSGSARQLCKREVSAVPWETCTCFMPTRAVSPFG